MVGATSGDRHGIAEHMWIGLNYTSICHYINISSCSPGQLTNTKFAKTPMPLNSTYLRRDISRKMNHDWRVGKHESCNFEAI